MASYPDIKADPSAPPAYAAQPPAPVHHQQAVPVMAQPAMPTMQHAAPYPASQYPAGTYPAPAVPMAPAVVMQPAVNAQQIFYCQNCRQQVCSTIERKSGACTWLACLGISLLGGWIGCCLIPFCVDDCMDTEHTCPACHSTLAVARRL